MVKHIVAQFAVNDGVDRAELRAFLGEVCSFIDENEPGTLAFDCFIDSEGDHVLVSQIYEDQAAYDEHARLVLERGVGRRLMQFLDMRNHITIDTAGAAGISGFADPAGPLELARAAGLARPHPSAD